MGILDDVRSDITTALAQKLEFREGEKVHKTEDIFSYQGVKSDVTMLYADLADSTGIATYDPEMAARLIKAFLSSSARLIRHNGGYVRSFDGDRVMGVFIDEGNSGKNTSAVKCAMNIDWAVHTILKPYFKGAYTVFNNGTFPLYQCVGIDTGKHLVVRAGIRNNNDLTWVGRAANVAAKLSTIRNYPYTIQITQRVYNGMNQGLKLLNGKNIWYYKQGDDLNDPNTITYADFVLPPT
jgi:class 3 adenylate cyclase